VWAFQNSAWVRIKRYTGTIGPSLTEEFVGQYFYLKLAIDPSRRIIDNLETRRSG
jgi:hypothetical protein